MKRYLYLIYLILGIVFAGFSIVFMMLSISYMERAMVATSLTSILVAFALLSSALYTLRLSSYVYASSRETQS
uniref:Uncharacterized protein n=1 Tax=Ignisphaera aggregans TaxID=334771 RepID=A0A7C4NNU0_9CREN